MFLSSFLVVGHGIQYWTGLEGTLHKILASFLPFFFFNNIQFCLICFTQYTILSTHAHVFSALDSNVIILIEGSHEINLLGYLKVKILQAQGVRTLNSFARIFWCHTNQFWKTFRLRIRSHVLQSMLGAMSAKAMLM